MDRSGYRGREPSDGGHRRRWHQLRSRRFGATLVGALLATLLANAALQLVLGSRGVEEWFIAERLGVAVADADNMEAAYGGPDGEGRHDDQVFLAMRGILGRPSVGWVAIVSDTGQLVMGGTSGTVSPAWRDVAERAIQLDRPVGDVAGDDVRGIVYAVPMRLRDAPHALLVAEDRSSLARAEAGISEGALLHVVGGLVLGVPLFFLLGGRRLLRAHRQVLGLSTSDGLTALGNHRSFQEELRRSVATACREDRSLTLLLVDLDDFKLVNDRGGHRRGDEVLTAVAGLLRTGRPSDRAFRIGGDEFAVLLPSTGVDGGRVVAERLRVAVEQATLGVSVSIGVAELSDGIRDPDALWAHADAALYQVKHRGRNSVGAYDETLDGSVHVITPAKTAALRTIVADRLVVPAFQPIWGLDGRRLIGFEALSRLQPDADGATLTSIAEVFAVAIAAGRTGELDEVCRAAVLSRADLLPDDALLFLNVSPQSLGHPSLAGDRLAREVRAAGLRPERVVLEITERDIARPAFVARETERLRRQGFHIALDDVGAGNAGLEMLRHVPVEYVKVDREIVADAPHDQQARAVLLAVAAFARETRAFVIAEGVETVTELAFLRHVGDEPDLPLIAVHGVQGYLLGRPGPQPSAPVVAAAHEPRANFGAASSHAGGTVVRSVHGAAVRSGPRSTIG